MMVISFALPLHFPETDLRITPPSGLIAFAASLLLGLLLSPDAVQAEYRHFLEAWFPQRIQLL